MRTRVKICGITRAEDALAAVAAGADAIGLVFEQSSPRCVTLDQARAIVAVLPPYVTPVALFVNAEPERIENVLNRVGVNLLQFHGDETPDQCRRFGRPYVKAVRMREGVDPHAYASDFADAAGLLLDTYAHGPAGGTGETFDWARVPRDVAKPVILAGGLTPDNVREAIMAVGPHAVDVSSGVERSKGVKDAAKIAAFIAAVRSCHG